MDPTFSKFILIICEIYWEKITETLEWIFTEPALQQIVNTGFVQTKIIRSFKLKVDKLTKVRSVLKQCCA